MTLRKTSAAVFVALMAVGAGAQAAAVTSITGSGTFTGGVPLASPGADPNMALTRATLLA